MHLPDITVEFDDMVSKWLSHISEITGKSTERIIADGIYNQVSALEEKMSISLTIPAGKIILIIFSVWEFEKISFRLFSRPRPCRFLLKFL